MNVHVRTDCTGPNRACRAAAKAGRTVHIIPAPGGPVLNTYHYATEADARAALADAEANAPIVHNDADLARYRAENVSYRLPVGWCDPTMRRASDRGYPRCVCGHPLCFMDRRDYDECPACDREIHPYLRLDNDFRPTDPSVPAGFIPMNNGLVPIDLDPRMT
jgi:hypothetical protein